LSDSPPTILAYASPNAGVDPSEVVSSAHFDPPPIVLGLLTQLLWIVLGFAGIGVTIFVTQLMISPGISTPMLILPALVFVALTAFCLMRGRIMHRQWRFGRLPVGIIVTREDLVLIDPPQWGAAVQRHPLATVLGIGSEFGGWWFSASWLYRINISIHQRDTAELCVSVKDVEAFSREIANLQSQLQKSNEVTPSHA